MTSSPNQQSRIAYLDGIRALAILAVIGVHLVNPYVPVLSGGYVGVDVFFVLSGFIITRLLWQRDFTYGGFIRRRLIRLYPALCGLLVVGTLVVWAFGYPVTVGKAVVSALEGLGQTASFLRASGASTVEPFAHTWSLAVEWYFYLLWPLAVATAKRRGVSARAVAGSAGLLALVLYAVTATVCSGTWFYYGPSARVGQLLAGAALALVPAATAAPRRAALVAGVSLVAVGAYVLMGPVEFSPAYRWLGFPVATFAAVGLVRYAGSREANPVGRLLTLPAMTWIGRISYSLYLWHLIGIQVLSKDRIHLPMPVLAAVGVAMAVGLSLLSYYLVERPFAERRGRVRSTPPIPPMRTPDAAATRGDAARRYLPHPGPGRRS